MGFQKRRIEIFWTLCERVCVCVDKLEGHVVITGSRKMQLAERAHFWVGDWWLCQQLRHPRWCSELWLTSLSENCYSWRQFSVLGFYEEPLFYGMDFNGNLAVDCRVLVEKKIILMPHYFIGQAFAGLIIVHIHLVRNQRNGCAFEWLILLWLLGIKGGLISIMKQRFEIETYFTNVKRTK